MKKFAVCTLLPLLLFLFGCSTADVPTPVAGTYELEHSEFPLASASLTLLDDNRFTFILHPGSSFLPTGTYSVEGNRLILTVDNEVAYVFTIEEGALVFIADESWEIPSFRMAYYAIAPTPSFTDGDRFVLRG